MKAIGIVVEYNPFHNGHSYQIQRIKEKYPDYAIVVVMSGHFMQRGDVAIIDKWKRCQIALENGVDLVVELPFPFATQSADFFAYGAITILELLKVERVIFGSESEEISDLKIIADAQVSHPDFDKLVKIYSKMGCNYPTALSKAVFDLTEKRISSPNDLLGISYIKTILKNHYSIIPEAIKRTNDYHSTELDSSISSATAIRKALKKGDNILKQIPKNEVPYLENMHFFNDYFPVLKYKIITEKDLSIYQTVDEGIDSLLKKNIDSYQNIDEYIHSIKSKRNTYNKISRMLIHILCGFTKEMAHSFQDISYIRILGLNSTGRKYLNGIKKDLTIPLISKITREKDPMLEFEMNTTRIYDFLTSHGLFKKEYDKILYIGDDVHDQK